MNWVSIAGKGRLSGWIGGLKNRRPGLRLLHLVGFGTNWPDDASVSDCPVRS